MSGARSGMGGGGAAAATDPRPPQYRVVKHGDDRDQVIIHLNNLQVRWWRRRRR